MSISKKRYEAARAQAEAVGSLAGHDGYEIVAYPNLRKPDARVHGVRHRGTGAWVCHGMSTVQAAARAGTRALGTAAA